MPEGTERDLEAGVREDSDFDDIEGELVASSREASLSFVPFASLDLLALSSEVTGRRGRHLRAVR